MLREWRGKATGTSFEEVVELPSVVTKGGGLVVCAEATPGSQLKNGGGKEARGEEFGGVCFFSSWSRNKESPHGVAVVHGFCGGRIGGCIIAPGQGMVPEIVLTTFVLRFEVKCLVRN